jgi:acyl-CoA thioester hydrolase
MYKKEFEIRWSDIDANAHLANAAYTNFMSHTRMAFFAHFGFSMSEIKKHNLAPVVFYEHMYYFKESFLGTPITVSIEVSGLSDDGMLFMFEHNFYNDKGENLAYCEMQGAWIDVTARTLTELPESLLDLAKKFPRSKSFKTLTKADTRAHGVKPKPMGV